MHPRDRLRSRALRYLYDRHIGPDPARAASFALELHPLLYDLPELSLVVFVEPDATLMSTEYA